MNKLVKKISVGIVSSAVALSLFSAPAFAATLEISGNGNKSDNTINVSQTTETVVLQENSSDISNRIDQSGNTGGNKANSNTGGSVDITTGAVTNTVVITNTGGGNTANVDPAGPAPLPDVNIKDNGNKSTNNAGVILSESVGGIQANSCTIKNKVKQKGKTGKNKANKNTGGPVTIITDDVTNGVTATNTCGNNELNIPKP